MKIQLIKLESQLDTLFIDAPEISTGSIQIWFRAGSALEGQKEQGIAHFLEHMFFKGTKTRPGAALTKEIESYGGEVNAFTSFDYTCYYINSPKTYINKSVEILLDMVTNPEFKLEELIPERGVVFEEYRRSIDSPGQFAFKEIQKSCFTKGYSHPILGNEKTINNFSRQQLLNFRKKYYNLSNALLIVSGNLHNQKKIISIIEKYLLPAGPKSHFPSFKLKNRPTLQVHKKEVRMIQLSLVIQSPNYLDKKSSSEDLAINCLGHGETSRLYKALVLDSSLANNCTASSMFFSNGGAHFIKITCPPENLKKVYSVFCTCVEQIVNEGLTNQELIKIKNQYIASKIYEKESIEYFAFSLGHGFAQNGNIYCEEEFIENIRKVGVFEVNNSFIDIFSRPIHFNLQIPQKESPSLHKEELRKFQFNIKNILKNNLKKTNVTRKVSLSKNDPHLTLTQLKDGIKLLHRQNTMTPTFIFHCYIKGGITHESKNDNGVHYLINSVMTKGYNKIPYEKIKTSLEEKSSSLSGFSGKNTYGLTLHGQTEHTDDLFKHFFGSLLSPDFLNKHLVHEKKMIMRTLESQKEDPTKQCFKTVSSIFFKNHPYSLDLLGTPQSIKNLTSRKIKSLHEFNLRKNEILFTYCGDLSIGQVVEIVSSSIESLKSRKKKMDILKNPIPIFGKEIMIPFDREQTQIFIGLPSFNMGDKRDNYLKILTTYLSGQSSELFVEVRDKQGLCYAVQPVHFTALEGGYWGIYMASGHDKTKMAISAIKMILNKIQKNGFSKKEFLRVKKMIDGQNLINLQTNEDYANIYSIPELHGLGLNYFYNSNAFIHGTSLEEFNKFISTFLNKDFNIVIAGRESN